MVKPDPSVDMKTPPKVQVDSMPADKYFAYAAELLKVNGAHLTDQPIVARMKRIGIEAGKSFDFAKIDPSVQRLLKPRLSGAAVDEVEGAHTSPHRRRLVDEHRHYGCVRQLLPKAGHRGAARPRCRSARGRDLTP